MAKRPQLDLAAAMAADLVAHDPMSTKPHAPMAAAAHETKSSRASETMSPEAHEIAATSAHGPESAAAHDDRGASAHDDKGSRAHGGMSPQASELPDEPRSYVPPSRSGMKRVQGYVSPRVKRQLRILAINSDASEEELVGRALNLLFAAEGLPAIAFDGKDKGRGEQGAS